MKFSQKRVVRDWTDSANCRMDCAVWDADCAFCRADCRVPSCPCCAVAAELAASTSFAVLSCQSVKSCAALNSASSSCSGILAIRDSNESRTTEGFVCGTISKSLSVSVVNLVPEVVFRSVLSRARIPLAS